MCFVDREELIASSSDENLQRVLKGLKLEEFRESFLRRSEQQTDFCIVVAERIGGKAIPYGLAVQSINADSITGELFANEMPRRKIKTIQVSVSNVLDVRFIDCGILQLGETYRYLLATLPPPQSRFLQEHRSFIVTDDNTVNQALALLRNDNASTLDFDLWKVRKFCAAVPGYRIPGHHVWYSAHNLTIQELNAIYGSGRSTQKLADASLISAKENAEDLLFMSTCTGNLEVVAKLIELGASCDKVDAETGLTPLIASINDNELDLARLLLRNGANPNTENYSGRTALYFCASPEAVRLLANNGTNLQHEDADGLSPLDKFHQDGNSEICDLLLSMGARSRKNARRRDSLQYPKIEYPFGEALPIESFLLK